VFGASDVEMSAEICLDTPRIAINLLAQKYKATPPRLVQIQLVPAITGTRLSRPDSGVSSLGR
jgi:hypothetical protein